MENKVSYMQGAMNLHYDVWPMPKAGPDQAVVAVEYVGVCGSDLHFFETGYIGPRMIEGKQVLGHEAAGVVVEVGGGVTNLRPGDKVALEPGEACGQCRYCKEGLYNLCPNMRFMSSNPYQGAMRKFLVHPAQLCFKLPQGVSTLEGALIEPLAVGLHAARQAGVTLGQTVAILGAGAIGLTTLLSVKAMGASKIIITDLCDNRLDIAKKLGADIAINSKQEDAVKRIMELTSGEGADIVFETAGSKVTASQTGALVRRSGTIMIVGNVFGDTPFNFHQISTKEATIKTVFRYRNIYPLAIRAIENGTIDVQAIVSDIFPFDKIDEGLNKAMREKDTVVKAVIRIKDEEDML